MNTANRLISVLAALKILLSPMANDYTINMPIINNGPLKSTPIVEETPTPYKTPVIIGHISDEHIQTSDMDNLHNKRLNDTIKGLSGLELSAIVSSGDMTDTNTQEQYETYIKILNSTGFSGTPFINGKTLFFPIPGNHDQYGLLYSLYPEFFGEPKHSTIIGNVKIIGIGGNPAWGSPGNYEEYGIPFGWLEQEIKNGCEQDLNILVFYHYCPHGCISDITLDMPEDTWQKLHDLFQKYDCVKYYGNGHSHMQAFDIFPPGFISSTVGPTSSGQYEIVSIDQKGNINIKGNLDSYAPVMITSPGEYYPGIDSTITRQETIRVEAFAKGIEGELVSVICNFNGLSYPMERIEGTDMYTASMDANSPGLQSISVTADHRYGPWADGYDSIDILIE